ncbi:putative E3 ubiquitin-protein ligase RNF38 [Hypsibius exemplaris]|uniref:E3 ubiquitin-protein ligase RNF38 n=1 Tax=Hypsibius exemplaris TaxID=2072580 RepID=A0A1W0X0N5_HYPEX|nr:putative E3 ubiquitin-protein ligase RNF38 [Hypsibius exemplaris]
MAYLNGGMVYEIASPVQENYLWDYYYQPEEQHPASLGSRRKRRRLMDMIDTNVPSNHPGMSLYEFIGPDFVDHFSAPLPPVNSSSHVGVAMSSASTSSSLGAHNRAPSRLSSSSSSSDGTNGGPSSGNHRVRRLSSRRKRVADLQNPPIYNVNGHLVQMQPHHHPGVPYPPGVAFGHAFCQAHALGHACSANHVHMNAATGSISAVPHLCCNVAMCPMQQQRATGHAGSVVGGAGYPGMGYASSGQQQQQQQQQQQIHPNSSQSTRHSQQQQQSMNQSMPSSQPHRTSQPYLPSDMLPGSHPYRTTPASYSQMIAASMQQQQDQQTNAHRLSHSHSTGSLPSSQQQHVLSGSSSAAAAAVRQQYSRHPGQASSESMAMYGAALSEMAAVAAGGGGPTWVSRRRMTENVTPATHLSQQNAAAGVRINSGVPFMTYDSGYFHHFQLARANQNSMSVGGPGYPYGAGQMDMSGHPHEHEQYELMLNIADRLNCESKPKGLTKQEIEKIRLRRFSGEKTDHGQTACVICICDFEPKQSLRQLPCTHEFHAKCVDKWLKSNRSCPICRGDASVYMKKSKLH